MSNNLEQNTTHNSDKTDKPHGPGVGQLVVYWSQTRTGTPKTNMEIIHQ